MKKFLISLGVFALLVFSTSCSPAEEKRAVQTATDAPMAIDTESPIVVTMSTPEVSQETIEPITITHVSIPGEPEFQSGQKITDCNTGERHALGATTLIGTGCDDWTQAKLERPVDAINGTYFPELDILSATMGTNQAWIFAKVTLYPDIAGKIPSDLAVGLELDIDLDSRGEFLLLAMGLNSTEWTTERVQVWQDLTEDVGGVSPHKPDESAGNGYETLIFDGGLGTDPDLAWVRIDPTDGSSVEFAFKPSFLPANQKFAWWVWTSKSRLDPAAMEFVDSMQNNTAWYMDNTCGWIFNANPSNILVNICPFSYPTATPTVTPTRAPNRAPSANNSCTEPNFPGYCSTLGPGWIWYEPYCKCTLFN
jgi:hypothetical protein